MNKETRVSVITPTRNRAFFLELCKECFLAQTYSNVEWLILDDSEAENTSFQNTGHDNIRYIHSPRNISIGEKRNRLIEASTGEIIVNFDDDDYYAPNYIETVVNHLGTSGADMINLRGFFIYNANTDTIAYWDLNLKEGLHYKMSGDSLESVWFDAENNGAFANNHLGYGFGWTFKKDIWRANPYPDMNWNEDGEFALMAQQQFDLQGLMDDQGLCLHMIHMNNTSISFPQYLMPGFMLAKLFPLEAIQKFVR
jgi:glycosyltransferase involved in cell wall biosynthesis